MDILIFAAVVVIILLLVVYLLGLIPRLNPELVNILRIIAVLIAIVAILYRYGVR